MTITLRTATTNDYDAVMALWRAAGTSIGATDTPEGIRRKIERDGDLFLLALADEHVVGAVMGAYDGRRGWAYHLAVLPDYQKQGIGTLLMRELEVRLLAKGCVKLNLFVEHRNAAVQDFYARLGYTGESIILMHKWLTDPRDPYDETGG